MVEGLAFAAFDQLADALGDCGFQLKCVLQGNQAAGGLLAFSRSEGCQSLAQNRQVLGVLNQFADVDVGND